MKFSAKLCVAFKSNASGDLKNKIILYDEQKKNIFVTQEELL